MNYLFVDAVIIPNTNGVLTLKGKDMQSASYYRKKDDVEKARPLNSTSHIKRRV